MAPVDVEGYWGKQTATIDWCEENYIVSFYIAEFWNTVSNVVMIFAPLLMLVVGVRENHERRYLYSFAAVSVVGSGSWLFHMTLQYSGQLMDELPMIWGSAFIIYSMAMVRSKLDEENVPLQLFLVVYSLIVSLVYVCINAPVFHEAAYALMVISMVLIAFKIVFTVQCTVMLFVVALLTYSLGFILWNVDNWYCQDLRYIRNRLSRPSGILFQLHAWWHIFAGSGTYLALLFSVHTRFVYLQKQPKIKLFLWIWPYVTIRDCEKSDKLQ